ncbi:MAG: cell division protein ZapE [Pseudomonadota bacterium]
MPRRPSTRYRNLIEDGRLDSDAGQLEVLERLDALALQLDDYGPPAPANGLAWLFKRKQAAAAPPSVYIWGDVGRGKTLVMDLFHEAIAPKTKRRIHFHAFMQEVHRDIHVYRRDQDKGLIDAEADPIASVAKTIAGDAAVLCLDEFQVKDITDAMILGRLFEALHKAGCVIVATSNIPPDELYRNGLNRKLFEPFIDFINSRFDIVELDGPSDYRLEKLSGEEVYFCPLGPGSLARLKLLWHKVTGQDDGVPAELQVQGRVLPVSQTARGAAWFTFAELCDEPLGAADYLAIANAYKVVFIQGVRELSEAQGNAARRFINLIDTLYDAHARVVISADTPPQGIYRYADTPVEFARTVSRLTEMQSEQWWQQAPGAIAG